MRNSKTQRTGRDITGNAPRTSAPEHVPEMVTVNKETKKRLPEGFTCACGVVHRFHAFVYAHWDTELSFECGKCHRSCIIFQGEVQDQ